MSGKNIKIKLTAFFLLLLVLLVGCTAQDQETEADTSEKTDVPTEDATEENASEENASEEVDLTPEGVGVPPQELGIYDGYFDGESQDLHVECLMGTRAAYKLEGSTLTFTAIDQETIYTISGKFRGQIVIDVGDAHKFELEFRGFSMISDAANPITVRSGEEVSLKAKKGYDNYIYDDRDSVDPLDETLHAGAIFSDVDLEIGGKGKLTVVSKNNNGIHTKDDLQVKNLSLLVFCADNALKGNDSVTLTGGALTLIATQGDGIKTSSTDFSPKGKQRGSVEIAGGTHEIYAAADALDAAYNVTVTDSTTRLTIYTERYSNYTAKLTEPSESEEQNAFSSKGIRAGNVVVINEGTVHIKSYDDAIHASKLGELENGASPIGNVTLNGGSLTLNSQASGIRADGTLKVVAGTVNVLESYEGFEASYVDLYGGSVSIRAKDDGINATASVGEGIRIRGGNTYIYAEGDGIDSNSQTEGRGIAISGGRTVIVSVSDGNSAIDTEGGYAYEDGLLLAVMPQKGMVDDAIFCPYFADAGKAAEMSLTAGKFLTAKIGAEQVTLRLPLSLEAAVIVLGDASSELVLHDSVSVTLDQNGVAWN